MSEGFNIIPNLIIGIVPDVFHHNFLSIFQVAYFGDIRSFIAEVLNKMQRFQC